MLSTCPRWDRNAPPAAMHMEIVTEQMVQKEIKVELQYVTATVPISGSGKE
jgi:hypothetical protein